MKKRQPFSSLGIPMLKNSTSKDATKNARTAVVVALCSMSAMGFG